MDQPPLISVSLENRLLYIDSTAINLDASLRTVKMNNWYNWHGEELSVLGLGYVDDSVAVEKERIKLMDSLSGMNLLGTGAEQIRIGTAEKKAFPRCDFSYIILAGNFESTYQ
jgi:hypothetical protein